LSLALSWPLFAAAQTVCFQGYVMDRYCIERGTLLDNPSLSTLENPEQHSLLCLLDPPQCVGTPFELLERDPNQAGVHCRSFVLDSLGKSQVVAQARALGATPRCTTCTGGGSLQVGYSATVIGTVGTGTPPLFTVQQPDGVQPYGTTCAQLGMPNATSQNTTECTTGGSLMNYHNAHGSLMLISWGLVLPSGVLVARFLRHRDPLWFHLHYSIQSLGLAMALIGWAVALSQFSVLETPGWFAAKIHATLGCVTMALGLFQPINALLRPHKEKSGEAKSSARRAWELFHKASGLATILLSIATVAMGTGLVKDPMPFRLGYGLCWAVVILVAGGLAYFTRLRRLSNPSTAPPTSKAKEFGPVL